MREDSDPPRYEVSGVTLRLRHPQPRDLGGLLRDWGFAEGRAWQAGDPRTTPKGTVLKGTWRESYAYAELPLPESGILSEALAMILGPFEAVREELRAFAKEGGRAELYVYWHFEANSGDTLDWALLRRLAEHRLDLALDIYPERNGKG